MKIAQYILAGCLVAVSFAASAQTLPAKYKTAGALNVAMFPAFPPLAYKDPKTNEMIGIDVEIGNAIGADLGIKINWVDVTYEAAIPSMKTERIDFALSLVNLPESQDALNFIDYIQSGAQFFVLDANKSQFTTPTSLCGQSVGASRRAPFVREMDKWSAANCTGKPAIVSVGTEGSADARSQLKQGRLQGVVQSAESIPYAMAQEPGVYALVGTPFTDSHISIGFEKGNTELRDVVKASFNRLISNGKYEAILAKYGLAHLKVGPRN